MIVRYERPHNWIVYDRHAILQPLTEAKAAILALTQMPYQRSWADELQQIQLKTERHLRLLNLLLDEGALPLEELEKRSVHFYTLKNPFKALIRDLMYLVELQAIKVEANGSLLSVNLEWPTQITETEFFKRAKEMPKGKRFGLLS